MQILPAIDLRGGQCVRLRQGDYQQETVFSDDPVAMAEEWQSQGAHILHLVDLDGAKAGPSSPASSVPPSVNANASLHVEKYKRGILVTGDTLQVYAQLKGLGGSWNRKLGGWILWPDQREEVIALLRKDPTNAVVDATNADDGGD